ncbi:hypothetical protein CW679_10545 [Macrococcoides caseolyticum]|uniref:hypothetical protein n=1 Tax=Macrococcoides caseolyticum TaxID=69966 RepID=UPI000C332BD1|nr:hypothetical protein [Macrococcus caseolyticus]PKE18521.1 hypothetical protein CW679_10545 [Macrococcus caseolyticus]
MRADQKTIPFEISYEQAFKTLIKYEMTFSNIDLTSKQLDEIYHNIFLKNDYYTGLIDESLKEVIIEEYH